MGNMEEMWKDVVGYEGLYEVSDMGRVRNPRTGRMLKLQTTSKGYEAVGLSLNGVKRKYSVHTLVLTAFVGPRPEGKECAHGNGNSSDNRLINLRWATPKENASDKILHGTNVGRGPATHCRRGHLMESPNLSLSELSKGVRLCLACAREANSKVTKRTGRFDEDKAFARYVVIMGTARALETYKPKKLPPPREPDWSNTLA